MSSLKIAITTGDVDGIGFEVTAKALNLLRPQRGVQFILWRAENVSNNLLELVDQGWKRITVDSYKEAQKIQGPYLVDIASDLSPSEWVEISARACLRNEIQALATAPLSKTSIRAAGYRDLGHTDILKRVSKAKSVNMGFVGSKFNVVLATAHIPLQAVSSTLQFKTAAAALWNANELRKKLPPHKASRPIGFLGVNPHAGEQGLIGSEEAKLFPRLHAFAKENNIPLVGPLVPDAAFFPENWKKFSVYVSAYHDQGLIPFKMIHGQDSGVHLTLGIPFIRTSVDHGTAKDIFGKNKANPRSMLEALEWAIKLARLR